ncbi:hypothetical protein [Brevibacillus thermoruber]|uniref:Uncharacterized protein n=1 Tax=Brevibacillus thermoruber TaxID=33942 RepID=A0A9X3TUY4_9BACL|nr:hypothetical protein [Brevibacillus thermoruber]MDA5110925.1 hypothetical protein [Brevibacillus thermoruber]
MIATAVSSWIPEQYFLTPEPFYFGIVIALLGLGFSLFVTNSSMKTKSITFSINFIKFTIKGQFDDGKDNRFQICPTAFGE